jgi:tetratricopeptide (TPR) repeat protein
MEIDVYAPCPCGSGKKLKFCCAAIIDDMAKVVRFQMADQPRQALSIIEKLDKSHPDNPWVVTTQAELLVALNEPRQAKERLERLLKTHADYPPAFAALALASLFADGYEAARPAIHRALQKCLTRFPKNAGMLVVAISADMQEHGHDMSARQYLSLAMRTFAGESREEVFLMLLRLDGDPEIPYPIRNVHHLSPYPSGGPQAAEASKASALATIGCWGPAARAYARIAEQEPQNAALWQNIGLCRAWDGDETGASEAFHRAAGLSGDFEFAVECETLGQLFDLKTTSDSVPLCEVHFPIRSASRLLGLLEGDERLSRAAKAKTEEGDDVNVAGEFIVRNKPLPSEAELGQLLPDEYPFVAATLTVFDGMAEEDQEAAAYLRGYAGEAFDSAQAMVERLAKDEIAGPAVSEIDESAERVPRVQLPFFRAWQLPARTSAAVRHSLIEARWRHLVDDGWFNEPQAALGGKSPAAAKGDPADRVKLTAAVYVLDALVQRLRGRLDFNDMLRRLELDPPQPVEPSGVTLSALSPMQLHRLPIAGLSDAQLVYTQRRATLVGHRRFVEAVLKELVARPQCLEQVDANRVYYNLVDIAQIDGRLDDAIAWSREARERASKSKEQGAFEQILSWTLTEFALRAEQPDDPELPALYRVLAEYYAPKVPRIAAVLDVFRQQYAERLPWLRSADLLVGSGAGGGGSTPGGLWTPSSAASPSPAGGKLWLPGQE